MTVAVCLRCGAIKWGALTPCDRCGHQPQDVEDRAKHLMLTDHYYPNHQLIEFGTRLERGDGWMLDADETKQFVEEYRAADRAIEIAAAAEDLIPEFCIAHPGAYEEFLEMFEGDEEAVEYQMAVSALLWRYSLFSDRIESAGKAGGWLAAEAEFRAVQLEDPRLNVVSLIRSTLGDSDSWIATL